jgi:hypothetical protein
MARSRISPPAHSLRGETPYGWRISNNRSKLVVDDSEQRVIAVIRHMYFGQKLPMRGIVDELRRMGVVNRRGTPFGLSRIFEIVHSLGRTVRPPGRPRHK